MSYVLRDFDLKNLTKPFKVTIAEPNERFTDQVLLFLEKGNNEDFARFLVESGRIKEEEANRIIQMIQSQDSENYEIAKQILQNKADELAKMSNM